MVLKERYQKNPEKWRKKSRDYARSHRKEINEQHRLRFKLVREKIIKLLGGKCIVCGYNGPALQIDHINSNGNICRKTLSLKRYQKNSSAYYTKILREIESGSKDYQLLCANHNWEKELLRREENYG